MSDGSCNASKQQMKKNITKIKKREKKHESNGIQFIISRNESLQKSNREIKSLDTNFMYFLKEATLALKVCYSNYN